MKTGNNNEDKIIKFKRCKIPKAIQYNGLM
jgi:hypothetical protein